MNAKEQKKISKFMSLVLRHQPQVIGLTLDENGWVSVVDLINGMKKKGYKVSQVIIETVVEENDKQRFCFSEDKSMIRANQGHSVDVDLQLKAIEPPEVLLHGTVERFLGQIYEKGIIKGSRHHAHLSVDEEVARKVGQRRGKEILLKIDAKKMHEAGFEFFQSKNGVWLTDHVPPEYISRF